MHKVADISQHHAMRPCRHPGRVLPLTGAGSLIGLRAGWMHWSALHGGQCRHIAKAGTAGDAGGSWLNTHRMIWGHGKLCWRRAIQREG